MSVVPEKWSIAGIHRETGISREKIGEIVAKHNLEPCGKNGKGYLYRLRPIVQAYAKQGAADAEVERARYYRNQAEKAELDISISKGELVKVSDVYDWLAAPFASIRETILGSAMPRAEQTRLLKQLQKALNAPISKNGKKSPARNGQKEFALK